MYIYIIYIYIKSKNRKEKKTCVLGKIMGVSAMILPRVHFKDIMCVLQFASGLSKLIASSLGIVCGI